uniref:Uncharacterized protein n=1 Tax=Glossina pallidipes TaxID=7398 RepID=A0A1A9Z963_GLOPL
MTFKLFNVIGKASSISSIDSKAFPQEDDSNIGKQKPKQLNENSAALSLLRIPCRRMRERVASLYNVCIEDVNIMGIILKTRSKISTKKFIDHVKSETSTTEINRDFYVVFPASQTYIHTRISYDEQQCLITPHYHKLWHFGNS